MSDSHCGSVGSFPAVGNLIISEPMATCRPCWDVRHFQNLSQCKCDQTFITSARRLGAHRPFSSNLHLLDFRFRSVSLSVTLFVFLSVSRADYGAATASVTASQPEGNDAGTVSENADISVDRSDVSDASTDGLSNLVPFYTIGFIIILALLLTRNIHKWIPCISSCMGLHSGCLPGSARALQNHQRSRSVRRQLSILSQLLIMMLCAPVFQSTPFVRAGETQTEPIACESPHQVATVAQAVTDSCEEGGEDNGAVNGGFQLPEHCSAECAAVFLPWFSGGQGTCFTALDLDEMAEQTFSAFGSVCETENSGVDMSGAIFVRPSDSLESQTGMCILAVALSSCRSQKCSNAVHGSLCDCCMSGEPNLNCWSGEYQPARCCDTSLGATGDARYVASTFPLYETQVLKSKLPLKFAMLFLGCLFGRNSV